jgi:hypothetical protein
MSQNNLSSQSNNALRTLHQSILNCVDDHEDNQQLLLFIGIVLNDLDIVQSSMIYENIDVNQCITARNKRILEGFGCNFPTQ